MMLGLSQEKLPYGSQNTVITSTKNCNKLTQAIYNRIFLRCVRTYFKQYSDKYRTSRAQLQKRAANTEAFQMGHNLYKTQRQYFYLTTNASHSLSGRLTSPCNDKRMC